MKRVWYAVICLSAILILCISEYFYTTQTSNVVLQKIDNAVNANKNGDYKKSKQEFDSLEEYWNSVGSKLQLLIDHNDLDKISLLVKSSAGFLEQGMDREFYVECAKLKECMNEFIASENRIINNIL